MSIHKIVIVHRIVRRLINQIRYLAGKPAIETCRRCGKEHNMCWHAPDDLWSLVNGSPRGVLCADCFDLLYDQIARGKGHILYWACKIDAYPE